MRCVISRYVSVGRLHMDRVELVLDTRVCRWSYWWSPAWTEHWWCRCLRNHHYRGKGYWRNKPRGKDKCSSSQMAVKKSRKITKVLLFTIRSSGTWDSQGGSCGGHRTRGGVPSTGIPHVGPCTPAFFWHKSNCHIFYGILRSSKNILSTCPCFACFLLHSNNFPPSVNMQIERKTIRNVKHIINKE